MTDITSVETAATPEGTKNVESVDHQIGEKITRLRIAQGMTRKELAGHIGVTHQQLHKYEKAQNRIAASRLWEVAKALNVPVALFFEDSLEELAPEELAQQRQCLELMKDFLNIDKARHQDVIRVLVKVMAGK